MDATGPVGGFGHDVRDGGLDEANLLVEPGDQF